MNRGKPTLRLSDDYVRSHRNELQQQYDLRQRIQAVEECIDSRWPNRRAPGEFGVIVKLEKIGDDWAILLFASVRGVRRVRFRMNVVAGHALLDEPEEV